MQPAAHASATRRHGRAPEKRSHSQRLSFRVHVLFFDAPGHRSLPRAESTHLQDIKKIVSFFFSSLDGQSPSSGRLGLRPPRYVPSDTCTVTSNVFLLARATKTFNRSA